MIKETGFTCIYVCVCVCVCVCAHARARVRACVCVCKYMPLILIGSMPVLLLSSLKMAVTVYMRQLWNILEFLDDNGDHILFIPIGAVILHAHAHSKI
jgi:hypothetical protein